MKLAPLNNLWKCLYITCLSLNEYEDQTKITRVIRRKVCRENGYKTSFLGNTILCFLYYKGYPDLRFLLLR
jgi:hypothetical protein